MTSSEREIVKEALQKVQMTGLIPISSCCVNPGSNEVAAWAHITPEMALAMLEKNDNFREKRDNHVDFIRFIIEHEQWKINGDTIKFNEDGANKDGLHRLWGVYTSGITTVSLIVINVKGEIFDVNRMNRTFAQFLQHMKVKYSTKVAAAVGMCWRMELSGVATRGAGFYRGSSTEINEWFEEHLDIEEYVARCINSKKECNITPNHLAAITYLGYKYFKPLEDKDGGAQDKVDSFIDGLLTGSDLTEYDPILVLRNKCQREGRSTTPVKNEIILAWIVKAWNIHVQGGTIKPKNLIWRKVGTAKRRGEKFPTIIGMDSLWVDATDTD